MAQTVTLEGLRSQILTQIFGRRLGLDSGGYLVGPPGSRVPVQSITSGTTKSTILNAYGVTIGRCTDASGTTAGWNLDNPVPGIEKILCMTFALEAINVHSEPH